MYVIFVYHPNQDNIFFCSFYLTNSPPNKQLHLLKKNSLDFVKEMELFPRLLVKNVVMIVMQRLDYHLEIESST